MSQLQPKLKSLINVFFRKMMWYNMIVTVVYKILERKEYRMDDDICGLDYSRLSILEKMKKIYSETCLKKEFEKIGLEMKL